MRHKYWFPNCREVLATVVALTAVAVISTAAIAETTLERAKRTGVIRAGYAGEVPWAYLGLDGQLTGSEPEIAKIIFKNMGITKIEAVLVEWAGLIPGLSAGRFDVITAGMYINPKRCKAVDFTDPHVKVGWALLVPQGNPKNFHSYEDVAKDPDAIISTMSGSADMPVMLAAGIPESRIMGVPDVAGQIAAVRTGRAHAASHNPLTVGEMVKMAGSDVERAAPFNIDESDMGFPAFAVRKGETDLRDEINRQLKAYIGTKGHLELVAPYGFTAAELSSGQTAAQLCSE